MPCCARTPSRWVSWRSLTYLHARLRPSPVCFLPTPIFRALPASLHRFPSSTVEVEAEGHRVQKVAYARTRRPRLMGLRSILQHDYVRRSRQGDLAHHDESHLTESPRAPNFGRSPPVQQIADTDAQRRAASSHSRCDMPCGPPRATLVRMRMPRREVVQRVKA